MTTSCSSAAGRSPFTRYRRFSTETEAAANPERSFSVRVLRRQQGLVSGGGCFTAECTKRRVHFGGASPPGS
ncbi:hypothetical protein EYF80_060345 [Liparis tanakae]|uniref:Uncharacterized protein n=1 Tax=Liparis tanakae TaxID=230148 RepID=A0A4Z2EKM6_9TELE|nr:hypothetical protein EYF80_060345 [Liparis tanakae]